MEPARTDAAQIRRRLLSEAVRQSGDVALAVLDELGGRGHWPRLARLLPRRRADREWSASVPSPAWAALKEQVTSGISLRRQNEQRPVARRGNTWSSTAPTRPDVSAGDDDQEQGAEGDGKDEQGGGGGEAAVG